MAGKLTDLWFVFAAWNYFVLHQEPYLKVWTSALTAFYQAIKLQIDGKLVQVWRVAVLLLFEL